MVLMKIDEKTSVYNPSCYRHNRDEWFGMHKLWHGDCIVDYVFFLAFKFLVKQEQDANSLWWWRWLSTLPLEGGQALHMFQFRLNAIR